MAPHAHVSSVEAIEAFRASLIVYLSQARPVLEEVGSEVLRTRFWLEHEARAHWEREIRRRTERLHEAEQALFGARLSGLREAPSAEQLAVRRAKVAVEQAEDRLKNVKRWCREFDSRIDPLARELDPARNLLAIDMPRAVAHLARMVQTLGDYAGLNPLADVAGATPGQAQSEDAVGTTPGAPGAPGNGLSPSDSSGSRS
jgi:hypothetical protein